jgi:hypothetical protein
MRQPMVLLIFAMMKKNYDILYDKQIMSDNPVLQFSAEGAVVIGR